MADITIQHVTFSDNLIEIHWAESSEVCSDAQHGHFILINPEKVDQDELNETLENLAAMVDQGLLLIRNPPATTA